MLLRLGDSVRDLTSRSLVIGILDRTRDPLPDGERMVRLDALLRHAERLVAEGADVLEVGCGRGGTGTRAVGEAAERDLAGETVTALRARFHVPLAIDTTRAAVAGAAFDAGAVLATDMSGFRDPGYLPAVAAAGAAVVATHCRPAPYAPEPESRDDDVMEDVVEEVARSLHGLAERAATAGVPDDAIVVDPGLDLGKTWRQSVRLLAMTGRLAALGRPVLLATSYKIFLGRLLHLDKPDRGPATVAACAYGVACGARLLRVHDVAPIRQAVDLVAAFLSDLDDLGREPYAPPLLPGTASHR